MTTKYLYEHVVQSNYGYGHGWEDVCAEADADEARVRYREYRENEPQYPHRVIERRMPNPEYLEPAS